MRRHARSYLVGSCLVLLAVAAAKGVGQAPDPQAFQERIARPAPAWRVPAWPPPSRASRRTGPFSPTCSKSARPACPPSPCASAGAFLKTLNATQRAKTLFAVDHPEWRKWANQHSYFRAGVSFEEMSPAQREAALAMLGASLSAKGLKLSRDIMRLNETLGELNGNNFVEYGERKYWISMMGEPSATEPWGWQLDGHHLNVNYFVLRDQVVMTPAFWGSEPAVATSGKYAGTAILQDEQAKGLAMVRALTRSSERRPSSRHRKKGTTS